MAVLLGLAGFVIDVGTWFRSQRNLQSQADASALAGAQALPKNTSNASALAVSYGTKNGVTLVASAISFSSVNNTNDSITVKIHKDAPTFFSKLFGIKSVGINAQATARASLMGQARYVAPITVNIKNPMLSGNCPCFDQPATIPLNRNGTPGAFGFLDLNNQNNNGSSTLASWITRGYDDELPVNTEYSLNTGAKFNSNDIETALTARIGTVLLFPVYDTIRRVGTIAEYHVVAWVGFKLTGYDALSGDTGNLYGSFTEITWEGIPANTAKGGPKSTGTDLGARVITLTG